ncbi:MAG: translation initiation factor IF-1 [Candidatus Paceibacterota bacterium]
MPKKNIETQTGTVTEALPNTMFRVQLDNSEEIILTYLSGKMRKYRIRVLVGDQVKLEIDPYGGKARIITRL